MDFQKYRCIFLSVILCCFSVLTEAQEANTMYFMKNIPQASFLNPAVSMDNDLIIGLPVISGMNFGFNNDFNIKNITKEGYGLFSDTLQFNFDSFYEVLNDQNKTSFEADVSMFFLGIRVNKNYLTISVKEKGFFKGTFDKRFVEYFKDGQQKYFGNNYELGNLSFDVMQYREIALGISRQSSNRKIDYGAKLKFLYGRMNMNASDLNFNINSSMADELLFLQPKGTMNISGPVKFETDSVEKTTRLRSDLSASDYFFSFKNLGLAADFGIILHPSRNFNVSASITDLGFLRFTNKNFIVPVENKLTYKRDKLTQSTNPSAPDYLSPNASLYAFRDSIPYMTTATQTKEPQNIALPVKVYFGGEYNVNTDLSIGFVQKLYFLNNYFYSASTFSAQTNIFDNFELTGTYSVIKNSYFNLGIGGMYRSNVVQAYFVTDNIFSIMSPSGVKNLNLHFGINLLIGNN
jgi:hypothetical protein